MLWQQVGIGSRDLVFEDLTPTDVSRNVAALITLINEEHKG